MCSHFYLAINFGDPDEVLQWVSTLWPHKHIFRSDPEVLVHAFNFTLACHVGVESICKRLQDVDGVRALEEEHTQMVHHNVEVHNLHQARGQYLVSVLWIDRVPFFGRYCDVDELDLRWNIYEDVIVFKALYEIADRPDVILKAENDWASKQIIPIYKWSDNKLAGFEVCRMRNVQIKVIVSFLLSILWLFWVVKRHLTLKTSCMLLRNNRPLVQWTLLLFDVFMPFKSVDKPLECFRAKKLKEAIFCHSSLVDNAKDIPNFGYYLHFAVNEVNQVWKYL